LKNIHNNTIKSKNNLHPFVFTKKTNTNYKLIPFNISANDIGKTKYLPPVSKEWRNTVYNYNYNNNINYPIYDKNINELIKGYFSLYFNNKFLNHKFMSIKDIRKSYNKIFVSKVEIKHTNNKAIITIYVFNKERLVLLGNIRRLRSKLSLFSNFLKSIIKNTKFTDNYLSRSLDSKFITSINIKDIYAKLLNFIPNDNLKKDHKLISLLQRINQIFSNIRRLRLKWNLNKYKFEDKFLFRLSKLISKYYGKKVEFNIVNLKSLGNNTDIFTEVLTLKLKKEKSSPIKRMNSLLARIVLPKVNRIMERGRIDKQVDVTLVHNKYKNLNLNNLLNKKGGFAASNLNKLLYNLYYDTVTNNESIENSDTALLTKESYYLKLREIIFNNIKYKNMGGARLVVKGRLTKRYRADRALYKFKWKGGLKNIDSAFKGLSSVVYRGYLDSNVEKATLSSKRRIGAFGVRSWISGK
jgi:hypothetical protein